MATIMLYSAFIVGLLGSFHCLGMCGPLVIALPVHATNKLQAITGRLIYNAGRICTYSLLGLILGTFGQSLSFFTSQQKLSVAIGILMLLFILIPGPVSQQFNFMSSVARFTSSVKKQFSNQFKQRSYKAYLFSGILNGLLPCGLVYVALAGAIATGSSYTGMAYMALFGLGTLPMMLLVSFAAQYITMEWRSRLTKVIPAFTIVVACLFILRGLNLGIPMVSPSVAGTQANIEVSCCHKK
jgi:sulfite exporter TauE/SafE